MDLLSGPFFSLNSICLHILPAGILKSWIFYMLIPIIFALFETYVKIQLLDGSLLVHNRFFDRLQQINIVLTSPYAKQTRMHYASTSFSVHKPVYELRQFSNLTDIIVHRLAISDGDYPLCVSQKHENINNKKVLCGPHKDCLL